MNVINRWKTVPKELRDETMEHEYGWMIKYLLESCTVLVPPEAVRKNSLSHIEKSLEHDLYELAEKASPKKPIEADASEENSYCAWLCPTCGRTHINNYPLNYCSDCGQKIDWSDYEKYLD